MLESADEYKMAKFHPSKLNDEEKRELFTQLCYVLVGTSNLKEAAELLRDLLTEQEVEMISKRLEIADLLIDGLKYHEIRKILKTSDPTISRVNEWLKTAGEGFRMAKERLKRYNSRRGKNEIEESFDPCSFKNLRRKFPMYYWPQIVLEEIIKNSNKKQKQQIRSVLGQMKQKTQLYQNIDKILKSSDGF